MAQFVVFDRRDPNHFIYITKWPFAEVPVLDEGRTRGTEQFERVAVG